MDTALDKIDPKSGEPIVDKGSWFRFPGYPKFYANKEYRGREMSVDEYIAIVNATLNGETVLIEGFKSAKDGKEYNLNIKINATEDRLDCTFPPMHPLSLKCPKSGQPIDEREAFYLFPGYPKLPCWKKISGREMLPEDYIKLLSEPYSPVEFTEFISKAGKPYTANLTYNPQENKFVFSFNNSGLKSKYPKKTTNQSKTEDDDAPVPF